MTKKKKNSCQDIKVAVVVEPLYKKGGAEFQVKYILEAFPNAEIYTAYCDEKFVEEYYPGVLIHHSFIQNLPRKFDFKHFYLLFHPWAYKSFNLKKYDVIISLSAAFSKFAHASNVKHVDICMTPPKFFWEKNGRTLEKEDQFTGINKFLFKFYRFWMDTFLEKKWLKWDKEAAQECTKMVAISEVVKKRIKKYYDVDADVIYPPVDVKVIASQKRMNRKENWFLYLGRIETYKGVDLAIKACVKAGVPLKIVGTGSNLDAMQELVKNLNAKGLVKFLGFISEEEKYDLLARTKALIFPVKDEDFGIVPVEANAAGTPVIAYKDGGVVETISDNNPKSGIFFNKYSTKELTEILKNFDNEDYSADNCRKQANNFAAEIFVYKLQNYIKDVLQSNN